MFIFPIVNPVLLLEKVQFKSCLMVCWRIVGESVQPVGQVNSLLKTSAWGYWVQEETMYGALL